MPRVCWQCPWRPCLCMWFGSGGPAPGPLAGDHQVSSISMSPLRVDCLLLRTPVTFADLDSSVQPVSAPRLDGPLVLSLHGESGDQGPGPQARAGVPPAHVPPGTAGSPGPANRGLVVFFTPLVVQCQIPSFS
ncbi:hypothetical protein mRhiFer1_007990 [Rhinolophus ferrumequinum]|uniref:Uncharacterized protein n=1 Tax=Rhinolophus ferrumequinum TaxID=59479 RepID=A0A7J7WQM5_RHIFE|nr:hypothetical protein mRhiFer1_007990 [Rhinolophus ferrumequinum]